MPFPKFIGIGAPRSGTRWLAECLAEHPEISLPPEEVYFFTTSRVVHSFWGRGVEWYKKLLADTMKPGAVICGEVTPWYLVDDDTPKLIHQCVPEVKLICLLRDQSERAYSWYRFFLKVNSDLYFSDYSFRRFLTYHCEVYGRDGFYLDHIQRYLNYFPRDSLLVLLYDDLMSDPLSLIRDVYRFLNVDTTFVPQSARKRINETELVVPEHVVPRSWIVEQTAGWLGARPVVNRLSGPLKRLNSKKIEAKEIPIRHRLDPQMRARMRDLYCDHNQRLGTFLGRDLSHWNIGAPPAGHAD
jgi:hypothetical protein